MKIIISPAKKMNICDDILEISGLPDLIQEAGQLCSRLKEMSYEELKALWKIGRASCRERVSVPV